MRAKEARAVSDALEAELGVPVFSEDDAVDMAESTDFDVIFVGGDILGLVYGGKPFLTVRGLLRYRPERRYVTVDMGAVPFVTNGADVMGPGIVEADPGIEEGDMVWIQDVNNRAPLAVGVSLRPAAALLAREKGKAIKMVHFVGDKLWKSGERDARQAREEGGRRRAAPRLHRPGRLRHRVPARRGCAEDSRGAVRGVRAGRGRAAGGLPRRCVRHVPVRRRERGRRRPRLHLVRGPRRRMEAVPRERRRRPGRAGWDGGGPRPAPQEGRATWTARGTSSTTRSTGA